MNYLLVVSEAQGWQVGIFLSKACQTADHPSKLQESEEIGENNKKKVNRMRKIASLELFYTVQLENVQT